jgi:AraC-like DNA-binding protein
MTESAADITGAEPAYAGAAELGFRAIEVLQEASRSAGWDGEYRQIEAGQLEAIVNMKQLGSASVTRERASRSLEVTLSSPESALTLLVSMSSRKTKINGHVLCADRAILLSPGTEIHTISPAGADVLTITIDDDVFGYCAHNMLQKSPLGGKEELRILECGSKIPRLRALSNCATRPAEDAPIESNLETLLIESIVQAVGAAEEASVQGDKYHRLEKSKVLVRLADHIDENLEGRITLSDLCEVGSVSQSTLQRLCRREFGLSPYEYVQARRLDVVRRQLQGRDRNMSIAEIAQRSGFNHMGRFAAIYRRQFGVLPSDSL